MFYSVLPVYFALLCPVTGEGGPEGGCGEGEEGEGVLEPGGLQAKGGGEYTRTAQVNILILQVFYGRLYKNCTLLI